MEGALRGRFALLELFLIPGQIVKTVREDVTSVKISLVFVPYAKLTS